MANEMILSPDGGRVLIRRVDEEPAPDAAEGDAPASGVGRATEEDLELLVSRGVLLEPFPLERLFVGWVEMTSSRVDSWGTWFDTTSLRNFAADVGRGSGLPLNRQHARGEFAFGKLFHGELEKLPEDDPELVGQRDRGDGEIKLARGFSGAQYRVLERFVIVRGLPTLAGLDTDGIIANLLATNIEAASIGGTIDPMRASKGDLVCDLCGISLLRGGGECRHMPRAIYYIDDVPTVATARYTAARQRHGSFVDEGATPSAGFLADRAASLLSAGDLELAQAKSLEDVYRAHIDGVPRTFTSYSSGTGPAPERDTPEPKAGQPDKGGKPMAKPNTPDDARTEVTRFLDDLSDGLAAGLDSFSRDMDSWEAAARVLADERGRTVDRNTRADARVDKFKIYLMERWGIEDPKAEDFDKALSDQEGLLGFAKAARDSLAEQYREAYIARHGKRVDIEKAMARTSHWTPSDFVDEIDVLRADENGPAPGSVSGGTAPSRRFEPNRKSGGRTPEDEPEEGADEEPRRVDLSRVTPFASRR